MERRLTADELEEARRRELLRWVERRASASLELPACSHLPASSGGGGSYFPFGVFRYSLTRGCFVFSPIQAYVAHTCKSRRECKVIAKIIIFN
jgi:hypothetical protein